MYNDERVHALDRVSGDESIAFSNHSNESASPGNATAWPRGHGERLTGDRAIYSSASATVTATSISRSDRLLASEAARPSPIGTLCDIASGKVQRATDQRPVRSGGSICSERSLRTNPARSAFKAALRPIRRSAAPSSPVGGDDLQIIFGLAHPHTIKVGPLQQNASIAATVNVDEMVRKHFAIVGSTGSGKSTGTCAHPAQDHGGAKRSAHAADRCAQ